MYVCLCGDVKFSMLTISEKWGEKKHPCHAGWETKIKPAQIIPAWLDTARGKEKEPLSELTL